MEMLGLLRTARHIDKQRREVLGRIGNSPSIGLTLNSVFAEPRSSEIEAVVEGMRDLEGKFYDWLSSNHLDQLPSCYWHLRSLDSTDRDDSEA